MRNNFENATNQQIIKNYFDENVFGNESTIDINDSDILNETIIEEVYEDEHYDLSTYIRIKKSNAHIFKRRRWVMKNLFIRYNI